MYGMTYYPRAAESALQADASASKVRLLLGARQTGKSTLLQRLAGTDVVFFNLQDRRTRLDSERDPRSFTQILEADRRSQVNVCVDEIQKVPALLDEIQYLHDRYPG